MVMILALATVKRPSDLNLLSINPRSMQVTADMVTYKLLFGAKNVQSCHPYGPTITLRWSEDECLWPEALVRDYLTRTKDGRQRSEKLFVTRKKGVQWLPTPKASISSWVKETLILANIRASGSSTRKAAMSYAASQGASIKTIMEVDDWAHIYYIWTLYNIPT